MKILSHFRNPISGIDLEKRVFGLDIARFFAIFFVCYSHGNNILEPHFDWRFSVIHTDGVNLFFVLSGFLIGRILIRIFEDHNFTPKKMRIFLMRRWFRTLPAYFMVLSTLILYNKLLGANFQGPLLKYYFFLQNFNTPHPPFFPEAWSLSVEEWFYIFFPALLLLGKFLPIAKFRFWILFSAMCMILWSLIYRHQVTSELLSAAEGFASWYGPNIRKVVLARFDSMMVGVLGAYLFIYHSFFWQKTKWPLFALGMFIIIIYENYNWGNQLYAWGVYSTLILSIGFLMLLPALSLWRNGRGLLYKFISWTSLISYSMYLVHRNILFTLLEFFENSKGSSALLLYAGYWILTFIISTLLYLFVEKSFMNLRDRYFEKQSI